MKTQQEIEKEISIELWRAWNKADGSFPVFESELIPTKREK